MGIMTCSVAMTTYNGAKFIQEQLRSIENQTIKPEEIVICDDGSKDNTIDVIKNYMATSKLNIRLYQNETNLGFGKNFEKSISLCENEVVFLCDQDDSWTVDKIEVMLKEFEKDKELVYAYSDSFVTDENLQVTNESIWSRYNFDWTELSRQEFFDKAQGRLFPLGFQVACRRKFLLEIIPFIAAHDRWIACCAAVFGNVKAVDKKLAFYRRHSAATSMTVSSNNKFSIITSLFKIDYYKYFLYPNKEDVIYKAVVNYIDKKNSDLDVTEIKRHLKYVEALIEAKDRNFVFRLKTLKMLKQNGLHFQYRGSGKTYLIDCLFMVINSLKKKALR